jgi:hypothetical protein
VLAPVAMHKVRGGVQVDTSAQRRQRGTMATRVYYFHPPLLPLFVVVLANVFLLCPKRSRKRIMFCKAVALELQCELRCSFDPAPTDSADDASADLDGSDRGLGRSIRPRRAFRHNIKRADAACQSRSRRALRVVWFETRQQGERHAGE